MTFREVAEDLLHLLSLEELQKFVSDLDQKNQLDWAAVRCKGPGKMLQTHVARGGRPS